MAKVRNSGVSSRKSPKQARSARTVEVILEAAVRVLEKEGTAGFNTARVAEKAGVSVGSLYQYFPNKQSILFRLQQDEWKETGGSLDAIFGDDSREPGDRLAAAMQAFFRSEWDEAPLRRALGEMAPRYRDTQAAQEHRGRGMPLIEKLIARLAPRLPRAQLAAQAALYVSLLTAMGKHVSETARSRAEVDGQARAIAEMFLASLRVGTQRRPG